MDHIPGQLYFQAARLNNRTKPKIGWNSTGNSVLMSRSSNRLLNQHRIGHSFFNVITMMSLTGELITQTQDREDYQMIF